MCTVNKKAEQNIFFYNFLPVIFHTRHIICFDGFFEDNMSLKPALSGNFWECKNVQLMLAPSERALIFNFLNVSY
jgi:hypothetical protein